MIQSVTSFSDFQKFSGLWILLETLKHVNKARATHQEVISAGQLLVRLVYYKPIWFTLENL